MEELQRFKEKQVKKQANSISRPKGDIELKNIIYRFDEKRYMGRKMIKGHRLVVYGKTQKECAENLKNKIAEVMQISIKKPDKEKYIFKNLWQKWFEEEKVPFIKEKSQKDIILAFKMLKPLHDVSIKKLTRQNLNQFFIKLPENRVKEKTRLYLNAFLEFEQKEGIIPVNPCVHVKVLKSNVRKGAFTYEQQKAILEGLKGKPLKVIILIYLVTGMRKFEFDFRNIEKNINFDERILKALNLKGRNFVVRYKQIKLSKQAISLIMNNLDIIHKYNAEKAYREFAKFLKEIDIEGSIVNLRHTFATNCFYLGKPELIISREMGHSRSQITKDVYTDIDYHLSEEKVRKLYNNLYNTET